MRVGFCIPIFAAFLPVGGMLVAQDASCNCRMRVALFDLDVQAPFPTSGDPGGIIAYNSLFWTAKVIQADLFNNKGCSNVTVIDGALMNASLNNGTVKYGPTTTNTAPAGPMQGTDYLLTGEITVNGSGDGIDARIEAAGTREVVAEATATFSSPTQSSMDALGHQISAQLTPLGTTISQFEIQKRESDTTIARDSPDGILTVTPHKQQLNAGESTQVDLKLTDCDGYPLKGRTIKFTAEQWATLGNMPGTTGGTFEDYSVVTDDNGQATTTFDAGQDKGPAQLYAWYGLYRPPGWPNAIVGQNTVAIHAQLLLISVSASYIKHQDESVEYGPDMLGTAIRHKHVLREDVNYYFQFTQEANSAGIINFTPATPSYPPRVTVSWSDQSQDQFYDPGLTESQESFTQWTDQGSDHPYFSAMLGLPGFAVVSTDVETTLQQNFLGLSYDDTTGTQTTTQSDLFPGLASTVDALFNGMVLSPGKDGVTWVQGKDGSYDIEYHASSNKVEPTLPQMTGDGWQTTNEGLELTDIVVSIFPLN